MKEKYDVLVVGARCAGAATALLLARAGLRVLAVDRSRYGTDTLSTHALMRAGVLQLQRWGVLGAIRAAGTPAVRATTFHYGDDAVQIAIQPRDGVEALFAPRRTVLDPVLVDAARAAGAEVRHGVRVEELLRTPAGAVRGVIASDGAGRRQAIHADTVIGADGADSLVARLVGARCLVEGRHAAANVFGYWEGLPVDGYHWYYREGASAGTIPTNDGLTCVFVAVPPERLRAHPRGTAGYLALLDSAAPQLREGLASARRVAACRTFVGRRGFLREPFGPGWALVGDAGYFKDPITAHGMTDALRDAELLARAVARGSREAMEQYAAERDRLSRPLLSVTDAIASFDWDLPLVRRWHRELSDAMAPELDALLDLDRSVTRAEQDAAHAA